MTVLKDAAVYPSGVDWIDLEGRVGSEEVG
jgi:hypothetical protein